MAERDEGEYRRYRRHNGPGKGDKQRPGDINAFREGWERIFGKKDQSPKRFFDRKDRALASKPGQGPGSCPEFS